MKRKLLTILQLQLLAPALFAAVPIRWTVESSRVQPAQFEGFHGETIDFEAALNTYGKPLEAAFNPAFFWQTNGMGSAYWTAPAVLSNNVMIARWEPAMDVGANVYSCFIGAPGEIYRAAFQLRLRPSPGAVPSELPLPVQAIDFTQIEVRNAPYYTHSETDARIIELAPAPGNYSTVSNRAMTAVQPSAISDMETQTHADQTYQPKGSYLTSETDPTVSSAISTHNSSTSAHSDIRTALAGKQDTISDLATIRTGATLGATAVQPAAISDMETKTHAAATYQPIGSYLTSESDPSVADWAKKPNPAPLPMTNGDSSVVYTPSGISIRNSSLAAGYDSVASDVSVAMGVSASAASQSFVWSFGEEYSQQQACSFNICPLYGIAGFFIGSRSMADYLGERATTNYVESVKLSVESVKLSVDDLKSAKRDLTDLFVYETTTNSLSPFFLYPDGLILEHDPGMRPGGNYEYYRWTCLHNGYLYEVHYSHGQWYIYTPNITGPYLGDIDDMRLEFAAGLLVAERKSIYVPVPTSVTLVTSVDLSAATDLIWQVIGDVNALLETALGD